MALDNYTDLKAEIQDWLFGRADAAAKADTFIMSFEAKVNRKLFVRWMEARSQTAFDMSATQPQYLMLPQDYQSMRRLRIGDGTVGFRATLEFITAAQLDTMRDEDDTPGEPAWFTVLGTEIEVYPTPAQAYSVNMTYRQFLQSLTVATGGVNWLLALAPDAYLYGSLAEAEPYLMNDERLPMWKGLAGEAFDDLKKLSDESTYNAGPLVIRRRGRGY